VDDLVLRDRTSSGGADFGKNGSGLGERLFALQDANWNVLALVNSGLNWFGDFFSWLGDKIWAATETTSTDMKGPLPELHDNSEHGENQHYDVDTGKELTAPSAAEAEVKEPPWSIAVPAPTPRGVGNLAS